VRRAYKFRGAWRMRRVNISYGTQSAQPKDIRRADPDRQGQHSFTAQQQTLRRFNVAFAAYLARAKAAARSGGKKPGYPRFKPYQRFNEVLFIAGDGAKWQRSGSGKWAYANFQAVGSVKLHRHRDVHGTIKAFQLKREHRRWYVIVIAQTEPVPLPPASREFGVDLGVARFLTTSVCCHRCGSRCARPRQNVVICPRHGVLDADVNGARNIASRAGLGSGQATPAA